MSREVADSLRQHRTIVVNDAHLLAPWADMLVALDGNWPQALREFAGVKVTSVADETLDARYIGPRWERVGSLEVVNSGLTAIRLAADMGAARIILAGFDPEAHGHFEGHPGGHQEQGPEPYPGLTAGLKQLCAELRARGIDITRI